MRSTASCARLMLTKPPKRLNHLWESTAPNRSFDIQMQRKISQNNGHAYEMFLAMRFPRMLDHATHGHLAAVWNDDAGYLTEATREAMPDRCGRALTQESNAAATNARSGEPRSKDPRFLLQSRHQCIHRG